MPPLDLSARFKKNQQGDHPVHARGLARPPSQSRAGACAAAGAACAAAGALA
jgi:hypothetical protein